MPDVPPPWLHADEKTTLVAFLDYVRQSVIGKLAGLTEEQARVSPVSSGTSLIGLLKHLTDVEQTWFVERFAGEDRTFGAADANVTGHDTVASASAAYRAAVARSNGIVAGADIEALAVAGRPDGSRPTLRWILIHMVEETARHAGHADILREELDGTTGR